MGKRLRPFFRIASRTVEKPQMYRIQTDGSFYQPLQISRTAVLAMTTPRIECVNGYFEHKNATESEWASVLDGLKLSCALELPGIELENDNLGIMNTLISKEKRTWKNQEYAKYCYDEIQRLANQLDWVEVRWIPREANEADLLIREQVYMTKSKNIRITTTEPSNLH